MVESKAEIIGKLQDLLNECRCGKDISMLGYCIEEDDRETAVICWKDGGKKEVDITADSGLAIIRDVLRAIG